MHMRMRMYMHMHMRLHMRLHMHLHMHMHMRMRMNMHLCMHVHMRFGLDACACRRPLQNWKIRCVDALMSCGSRIVQVWQVWQGLLVRVVKAFRDLIVDAEHLITVIIFSVIVIRNS